MRTIVLVLLTLALTSPSVFQSGTWTSVVYLVDASFSVDPDSLHAGLQWIEQANERGAPEESRILLFGRDSRVWEADPMPPPDAHYGIDPQGTDLGAALTRAIRNLSARHLNRLVLLSDGHDDGPPIDPILARLHQEGIPVFTRPISARQGGDCWVDVINRPAHATAGEAMDLTVQWFCQQPQDGIVVLKHQGRTLGEKRGRFEDGSNTVVFQMTIDEPGMQLVEVEIGSEQDSFPENNRLQQALWVAGRPRVLYVENRPESARYLYDALRQHGFDVAVRPVQNLPADLEALGSYSVLVLSDLPATKISDRQMEALAEYVEKLGGGLIVLGGQELYGDEGYAGTLLEEILPVTFTLVKRRDDLTVALILVLDKSGSMRGQKMNLAKEASKAALRVLKETDLIGVVAFDFNSYWPVELTEASRRDQIDRDIGSIEAAGETNIYPALQSAYTRLEDLESQVKHIILLSDGRSLPDDYQALVTRMTQAKITVSTVSVGSGSDRELLANIARWGNGRDYYLEDALQVPQIFTEETQKASNPTLVEEPIRPRVSKQVELLKGIDMDSIPPLLGYVRTQPKDTAEVLLTGEDDEPILARWQFGLGKTVVFTSDLKDRWSQRWLDWQGYGKFASQLVRDTLRPEFEKQFEVAVSRTPEALHVVVDAVDKQGLFLNGLDLEIDHQNPDQGRERVGKLQIGPGRYEAHFPSSQRGVHRFDILEREKVIASEMFVVPFSNDYRFYPTNTERLRWISEQTQGVFDPTVEDLFAPKGNTVRRSNPIWRYLLGLALILYLVDIALRRLRPFWSPRG